jgi:hypothetical protein
MGWPDSWRNSCGIGAGGGIMTAGEKGADPDPRDSGALGRADCERAREELSPVPEKTPDETPEPRGRLENGIPDPVRADDFGGMSVVRSSSISIICSRVNTRGRSDGGRGQRLLACEETGATLGKVRTTSISPERMSSTSSGRRFEKGSNGSSGNGG